MNRIAIAVAVLGWLFVNSSLGEVEYELVEVADSGSYFVYSYVLKNPASSTWGLRAATMDISASSGTPTSLPATGPFEDLVAAMGGATPYAEVGPISPTGWGAIMNTRSGLLWSAPSSLTTSSDSIAPGDSLAGFGLRSSYLPGLRRMQYEPTVESCCQEPIQTTPEIFWAFPDDYSVDGWSVGPRYMPSEVTLDVLQSQRTAVCSDPLWIDDAPLCTALADSLDAAETRLASGDNPGARKALEGVLAILDAEREPTGPIESNAYWLLRLNTEHVLGSILGGGDVATGSASGGAVDSVVTSTHVNGGTDQLYLAQVNIRPTDSVSGVSGGGLTWTLVGAKTGDREQIRVEVWKAFGSPGSAFKVTAFTPTTASTVTLTAVRYTGASANVEDVQTAGTCDTSPNGCASGPTDNADVEVTTTSTTAGALHFVALNPRHRILSSADPDYAVRGFVSAGAGGDQVNSCTFDHPVSSPVADTFAVTLNNPADWAVVAFVINPGSGLEGQGGQIGVLHVDCTAS